MADGAANQELRWNGTVLLYLPNSLKMKLGRGDTVQRTQVSGGGSTEIVSTKNAETQKSMISFTLANTTENIDAYDKMFANGNNNVFEILGNPKQYTFQKMEIVAENEINLAAEGSIEVSLEGPAVDI